MTTLTAGLYNINVDANATYILSVESIAAASVIAIYPDDETLTLIAELSTGQYALVPPTSVVQIRVQSGTLKYDLTRSFNISSIPMQSGGILDADIANHNNSASAHPYLCNQLTSLVKSSVPIGGKAGQSLGKASDKNNDVKWLDPPDINEGVQIKQLLMDVDMSWDSSSSPHTLIIKPQAGDQQVDIYRIDLLDDDATHVFAKKIRIHVGALFERLLSESSSGAPIELQVSLTSRGLGDYSEYKIVLVSRYGELILRPCVPAIDYGLLSKATLVYVYNVYAQRSGWWYDASNVGGERTRYVGDYGGVIWMESTMYTSVGEVDDSIDTYFYHLDMADVIASDLITIDLSHLFDRYRFFRRVIDLYVTFNNYNQIMPSIEARMYGGMYVVPLTQQAIQGSQLGWPANGYTRVHLRYVGCGDGMEPMLLDGNNLYGMPAIPHDGKNYGVFWNRSTNTYDAAEIESGGGGGSSSPPRLAAYIQTSAENLRNVIIPQGTTELNIVFTDWQIPLEIMLGDALVSYLADFATINLMFWKGDPSSSSSGNALTNYILRFVDTTDYYAKLDVSFLVSSAVNCVIKKSFIYERVPFVTDFYFKSAIAYEN